MGSSYTDYHGYGFWSRDYFIEQLAGDVAAVIENLPTKDQWLVDLAAHWKLQASGIFGGWVHLKLDDFLSNDERRSTLRALIRVVTERRDRDDLVCQTGVLLLRLLDGSLTTDAASPLDYMVGQIRDDKKA